MNWSIPALGLAFVGGIAIGIASNPTQTLRAQTAKPMVYGVYEAEVKDKDGYMNKFLPVINNITPPGGEVFLARGGTVKSLLGDPPKGRVVLSQLKDMDAATTWWNSQETKDAFALGMKYAEIKYYWVEGAQPK